MIVYKTGSLFEAPAGSYLVHACNAQGVWGSGIALEFKKRFPKSYAEYSDFCELHDPKVIVGETFITSENIVCLITSENYGDKVDSPDVILKNTKSALLNFLYFVNDARLPLIEIHSPKFNAGLFRVPWLYTEDLLMKFTSRYGLIWNVWKPEK